MNRRIIALLLPFLAVLPLSAQDILTAERFLAKVGEVYQAMEDYSALVSIETGRSSMEAKALFKAPNLMRLDFSVPEEQIIVFNGDTLTVYLPEYRAVLSQTVTSESSTGGASLASAAGLSILRRNYAVSYLASPTPLPLDEIANTGGDGTDAEGTEPAVEPEMVIKLVLSRRSLSEGFREIHMAIDPATLYIRRIEGTTIANENVRFNFYNISPNQGIADALFTYESQPSANFYDNFLYRDSE